jgi:hypothetical protein
LPVIKKAAELYPALCFELRYYRGCWDDPGIFSCAAGVVSDESEPYFGNYTPRGLRLKVVLSGPPP